MVQQISYAQEMKDLMEQQEVATTSSVKTLHTFIDKEDLRVGGRLQQSMLPYQAMHQMILPSNHHFIKLSLSRAPQTSSCWATTPDSISTRELMDTKNQKLGENSHPQLPNLL